MEIALVLLAGGRSKRMGTGLSKVFYKHNDKPIALYSLEVFRRIDQIGHFVVVCDRNWRKEFSSNVSFGEPGKERFLSLENALLSLPPSIDYVLVHDAARPVIVEEDIIRLIHEGLQFDGAALGSRMRGSIARVKSDQRIQNMEDRDSIWETHTPQFAKVSDLLKAISFCKEKGLIPNDEMSLLSQINLQPKIVESSFPNVKITYQSDLPIVCALLNQLHSRAV